MSRGAREVDYGRSIVGLRSTAIAEGGQVSPEMRGRLNFRDQYQGLTDTNVQLFSPAHPGKMPSSQSADGKGEQR
jgi:hypothetical protein